MLRLTAIFGIMTLLAALPAHADEVRLKNGDRLTGETVSLANGTLTFKTALDELRISWGDVTSLADDLKVGLYDLASRRTCAASSGDVGLR